MRRRDSGSPWHSLPPSIPPRATSHSSCLHLFPADSPAKHRWRPLRVVPGAEPKLLPSAHSSSALAMRPSGAVSKPVWAAEQPGVCEVLEKLRAEPRALEAEQKQGRSCCKDVIFPPSRAAESPTPVSLLTPTLY